MIDFRASIFINGILIITLATAMIIPAIVDLSLGHEDWVVFTSASMTCLFIGVAMAASTQEAGKTLSIRSTFIITTSSWILLATFSALPFVWSELEMSYADAFFEAMSGLTTTGATVIDGLDEAPPGILLWRGILQWLGGLGIIVMAIAILPMLQVGGMQLFKAEAFDTSEKILPRTTQTSAMLIALYVTFTVLCTISYMLAGMPVLDAIIHAMTTIATGGFSSHDKSIGHFNSLAVETVAIIFMIIGSLPFILYFKTLHGNMRALFRDSQVQTFLILLLVFSVIATIAQAQASDSARLGPREAIFNIVSIMTGTGYVTSAYDLWGPLAISLFFCVMFIGGCASSTSCGIKVFRFQVIYLTLKQHLNRILYPHGVFVTTYNGKPLSDMVIGSVMSFLFVYFLSVVFFTSLLTFTGHDMLTALSASATAISNVGPGLGKLIGPDSTFSLLSNQTKWILSAAMLLGRLEFFTVLVIFSRIFWRT